MKECELCSAPARMYCESDQASLCWECDSKVHCANFLVARHSRSLLCHSCQSVTPWQASGAKLGPTVSVCERCVRGGGCKGREEVGSGRVLEEERSQQGGNEDKDGEDESDSDDDDDDDDVDDDDDDDEDDDDDDDDDDGNGDDGERNEEEEDDEDGENQVVPWSPTPSPPVASTSSSEESSSRFCSFGGVANSAMSVSSLKRTRENDDLCYCSSSQLNLNALLTASMNRSIDEEATSFGSSTRPLKQRKKALTTQSSYIDTISAALISSPKYLERNTFPGDETPAAILRICKLSQDPQAAVDLVSSYCP